MIILIDTKTLEQVRNADMITFFERHCGFTFAHRGGVYRCEQHQSLAVKNDRISWYWHSKGVGGHGALDYLMKMEHMPFREAVEAVSGITPAAAPPRLEAEQPKTLILPEKVGIPLRLYDYLCRKRGIDGRIVGALLDSGSIYEDKRGNVVFVGCDEQNKARFASLRGTYGNFRMDCAGSDKQYGFNMAGTSERLYIFESPIDAMSHASLSDDWRRDSRLSLAGTSETALPFFLNQHYAVRELVICLDNDTAGREAAIAMARKHAEKGYYTRIELPTGKDFNEDLQAHMKQIQIEKQPKTSHLNVDI